MKKTYLAPTVKATPILMKQTLCMASIKSNVELEYGGAITDPEDFVVRAKDYSFDEEWEDDNHETHFSLWED